MIQELAGHADLTTTMRYMHLAKPTLVDANLLDLTQSGAMEGQQASSELLIRPP